MKKFLLLLIFLPGIVHAGGPLYRHKEPEKQLEFDNVYQDIRQARISSTTLPAGSTQYIQNKAEDGTLQTGAVLNIASGTIQGEAHFQGTVTQPGQPSFLVTNSAGATDVTGDGTAYTVLWGNEIFDQGSNFASNTFTAPVTGRYLFTASIMMDNLLTTHLGRQLKISTSNRQYVYEEDAPATAFANNFKSFNHSVIADMDANDTATITIVVTNGTKTVDIEPSAVYNTFSGSLIN